LPLDLSLAVEHIVLGISGGGGEVNFNAVGVANVNLSAMWLTTAD
jgi:hypothetical protein